MTVAARPPIVDRMDAALADWLAAFTAPQELAAAMADACATGAPWPASVAAASARSTGWPDAGAVAWAIATGAFAGALEAARTSLAGERRDAADETGETDAAGEGDAVDEAGAAGAANEGVGKDRSGRSPASIVGEGARRDPAGAQRRGGSTSGRTSDAGDLPDRSARADLDGDLDGDLDRDLEGGAARAADGPALPLLAADALVAGAHEALASLEPARLAVAFGALARAFGDGGPWRALSADWPDPAWPALVPCALAPAALTEPDGPWAAWAEAWDAAFGPRAAEARVAPSSALWDRPGASETMADLLRAAAAEAGAPDGAVDRGG